MPFAVHRRSRTGHLENSQAATSDASGHPAVVSPKYAALRVVRRTTAFAF
jgi:hypothetical protein